MRRPRGAPLARERSTNWGCSSAGRAPALQAGGQRFDPAQLHHSFGVEVGGLVALSYGENKVCIGSFEPDACSDYIVKRRYVWKLSGVLSNSYELLGMSEPSLIETMDDLADRIWWRDWR